MVPPNSICKALGAVKDRTSIGLANVGGGGSASFSDQDVAIVKATRHGEHPVEERYIWEILGLTHYSCSHISACVVTLSRPLVKTRSWDIAPKSLFHVNHLLAEGDLAYEEEVFFATCQGTRLLAEGDLAYEEEVFFATYLGTRLLGMSDFRDTSRSDPWNFSAFVLTYALYLDECLEYRKHRLQHAPLHLQSPVL